MSVRFFVPKMNGAIVGCLRDLPRPKCAPALNIPSIVLLVADIGRKQLTKRGSGSQCFGVIILHMKKYVQLGGFLLILILAFLFFYPINRFVQVTCANCTSDLTTTNDCATYLDTIKDRADFISLEKSFGVSNNNISNITKIVDQNTGSVECKYTSSGTIL